MSENIHRKCEQHAWIGHLPTHLHDNNIICLRKGRYTFGPPFDGPPSYTRTHLRIQPTTTTTSPDVPIDPVKHRTPPSLPFIKHIGQKACPICPMPPLPKTGPMAVTQSRHQTAPANLQKYHVDQSMFRVWDVYTPLRGFLYIYYIFVSPLYKHIYLCVWAPWALHQLHRLVVFPLPAESLVLQHCIAACLALQEYSRCLPLQQGRDIGEVAGFAIEPDAEREPCHEVSEGTTLCRSGPFI